MLRHGQEAQCDGLDLELRKDALPKPQNVYMVSWSLHSTHAETAPDRLACATAVLALLLCPAPQLCTALLLVVNACKGLARSVGDGALGAGSRRFSDCEGRRPR